MHLLDGVAGMSAAEATGNVPLAKVCAISVWTFAMDSNANVSFSLGWLERCLDIKLLRLWACVRRSFASIEGQTCNVTFQKENGHFIEPHA